MNVSTIRAVLGSFYDLSAVIEFQSWLCIRGLYNQFNFNSQNQKLARAVNDQEEVICYVSYTPIDDVFLITDFAANPKATREDAQIAGDAIDRLLEKQAQMAGVSRLLMIIPGKHECEELRVYRPVTFLQGIGCFTPSQAHYLN